MGRLDEQRSLVLPLAHLLVVDHLTMRSVSIMYKGTHRDTETYPLSILAANNLLLKVVDHIPDVLPHEEHHHDENHGDAELPEAEFTCKYMQVTMNKLGTYKASDCVSTAQNPPCSGLKFIP
jgi:hypothetical protein